MIEFSHKNDSLYRDMISYLFVLLIASTECFYGAASLREQNICETNGSQGGWFCFYLAVLLREQNILQGERGDGTFPESFDRDRFGEWVIKHRELLGRKNIFDDDRPSGGLSAIPSGALSGIPSGSTSVISSSAHGGGPSGGPTGGHAGDPSVSPIEPCDLRNKLRDDATVRSECHPR